MRIIAAGYLILFLLATPCFGGDYVIGDGDSLQISVWGVSELSAGVTVRPDGKITLPGIGDIYAANLTPTELSDKLSNELETFVKKPIVTVTVSGLNNSKVYVFGGGVPSGAMNLDRRTTLLKFLINLGSFANADLSRAYIMRDEQKLDVDFYNLLVRGDLSKDIPIQANDIIFIPDNEFNKIYVMGAVGSPKYIFYREGITILDAILESGGFTKFAKESKVLVLRKNGEKMDKLVVNADDLMNEGDLRQNILLIRGDFIIVKEGLF